MIDSLMAIDKGSFQCFCCWHCHVCL